MDIEGDNWKTVIVAGALTIAVVSSASASIDRSVISDPAHRLQQIRMLAEQGNFALRGRDGSFLVAGPGNQYNKIDRGRGK